MDARSDYMVLTSDTDDILPPLQERCISVASIFTLGFSRSTLDFNGLMYISITVFEHLKPNPPAVLRRAGSMDARLRLPLRVKLADRRSENSNG